MELQHITWSWDMITRRLLESEPEIGRAVFRSCRPIEAQRYRDGRLLIVIGCWWPGDMEYLSKDVNRARLGDSVGNMLTERVTLTLARWPGGMASALPPGPDEEQIPPPDILQGLPDEARQEAAKCESPIQRLFFARAYAKGLQLRCQFPLLHYRLDFALPERRTGAEVMGWDWRTGSSGAVERRDRQEHIEQNGWQIAMFSGSQVLADVDKCVASLAKLLQTPFVPGQQPLPSRYSAERKKPYSSIGTHRPPERGPRRPPR